LHEPWNEPDETLNFYTGQEGRRRLFKAWEGAWQLGAILVFDAENTAGAS